jgi:hypothetical protein
MTKWDDEPGAPRRGVGMTLLPFATAIGALLAGSIAGGVIAWVAKPPERLEVPVPRELTLKEIETMCAPQVVEKAEELDKANERIASLSAEVKQKNVAVQNLESEMARRNDAGRSMTLELEAARHELESLKMELVVVQQEKARLQVELAETVERLGRTEEALDDQVRMTDRAKEDALVNKWYRFLNDSQLEICERGNRKRLGQCREIVMAELGSTGVQTRFTHCVRSLQATPSVHEHEKGTTLPGFSRFINQEERVVKDWFIEFCDPTLPESDGFLDEEHLSGAGIVPAQTNPNGSRGGVDEDPYALPDDLFEAPAPPAPTRQPSPSDMFDPEEADEDALFELLDSELNTLPDELTL